ncbi:MAG: L-threonylcarbamoyladenylate synthase [Candidatus Levyibacteriota bacterium]
MNTNNIQEAVKVFKNGGIVVFPTDTAYGIGCRMDNADSVRKVFEIKKRKLRNALLVLVDSIEMAEKYVKFDPRVSILVKKYWPGGLSIFLNTKLGKVPGIVTANSNALAVRWPKHKTIEKIIATVGVPIIATSANISGDATPFTLEQVDKKILDHVDLVFEGKCTYEQESTIIDCSANPWKIIRKGAAEIKL